MSVRSQMETFGSEGPAIPGGDSRVSGRGQTETINSEGPAIPGGEPAPACLLPPIPKVAVVRL